MKRLRDRARNLSAALLLLAAALATGAFARAQDGAKNETIATIVRVWPGYRAADTFERISEYFTGRENNGGQIVLRTHPGTRAGFYFFTRLKTTADIAAGAQVEISVIAPDSPDAKIFLLTIPAALPKGTALLNPGLTGPDWPDAKAQPVAWRVRLLASGGAVLASRQSYLWSK